MHRMGFDSAFAVAYLILQVILFMVTCVFRIIGMFLLLPWFFPRRPRAVYVQQAAQQRPRTGPSLAYQVGALIHDLRAPATSTRSTPPDVEEENGEPSRNQADTALALRQLGYSVKHAERVAEEVANELGRNAPLNDMIKLGLNLTGRIK